MLVKKAVFFLTLSLILLISPAIGEIRVDEGSYERSREADIKVDDKGQVWSSYFDQDFNMFLKGSSEKPVLLNPEKSSGPPSGLTFDVKGEKIYAVWREKATEKKLILGLSYDSGKSFKTTVIDIDTEALPRIRLETDREGNVFVVWLGEKPDEGKKGPSHHIYAKYSSDHGKTFQEKAVKLTEGYSNSIYPTLIADGKKAHVFSWSKKEGKGYIIFRKTRNGLEWDAPVTVSEIAGQVVFIEPLKIGKRLMCFWTAIKEKDGKYEFIIEGAYSDDTGRTWKTFTLDETKGLDAGKLEVATDGKNHVHVAFSAVRKDRGVAEKGEKSNIYFIRSTDKGNTWEKMVMLNRNQFKNTHARYPNVFADEKGEVTAVWVDYRNIRSNIYMNHSRDFGKTWLEKDVPLEEPGKFNTELRPLSKSFVKTGDKFFVLAERFKDDAMGKTPELMLIDFKTEEGVVKTEDKGSFDKRSLLESRVADFWEAMVKADYEKVYDIFDPFYRAGMRKINFLAQRGRLIYHSAELKEIVKVEGNIAKVRIAVEYSMPMIVTKHGKFSQPKTKTEFTETWVYVYDNWYKEYYDEMAETAYTRY